MGKTDRARRAEEGKAMAVFMKYVGKIWRCANLYHAARYADLGLGPYQDPYLLYVCEHPGVSQEALARSLCVHKSNAARQLAALEKNGFIVRVQDEADRRVLLAYPTDKAQEALPRIRAVRREWKERAAAGISEEELETFARIAQALAENAERIAHEEETCGEEPGQRT